MVPYFCYPLTIAGIPLLLETELLLPSEDAFQPFFGIDGDPTYRVIFHKVNELPSLPESVIHTDRCFHLHPHPSGVMRSFFNAPKAEDIYAVGTYDYSARRIIIQYLEWGEEFLNELTTSFFHLGFDSLLIREQRLCIHSAFVRTKLGGILFSGPSGIGKSTQAELWCRFRNAQLINGDRPILSRSEAGWLGWGSPYAGSSKCYVNESCPVSAIVMLNQASVCTLRRLTGAEAFRAVYACLTLNSWDREYITTGSGLAMQLATQVPVYQFYCTPDEQAVCCLEQGLLEDSIL